MKINIIKKLKSVGDVESNRDCLNNKIQNENSFSNIQRRFNSALPHSYKDFYNKVGAFYFNELICVKCIAEGQFMAKDNKVSVGEFYCITGDNPKSVNQVLSKYEEQLAAGMLPICDGELGDIICISLRRDDFGRIYYFHHESPPDSDLFLITRNFEDFISGLEIYKSESIDENAVDKVKACYSPQFLDLLKKSGYKLEE